MPHQTHYVLLPFIRSHAGTLLGIEAEQVSTRRAAAMRANTLVGGHRDGYKIVGVIAFSRTGDPESGEFEKAEILWRYGSTPECLYGPG